MCVSTVYRWSVMQPFVCPLSIYDQLNTNITHTDKETSVCYTLLYTDYMLFIGNDGNTMSQQYLFATL